MAELNLSELISLGESNPEIKAALRKITNPQEVEALRSSVSDTLNAKSAKNASDFSKVMKDTDIPVNQDELFNPDVVRNPKVNGLSPAIPREPNLPITRDAAGVPSTLQANPSQISPINSAINNTMRDVTPPAPPTEPPALPPGAVAAEPAGGMSDSAKLGLGATAATAGLLSLQGDTDNHPSDVAPPARQVAGEAAPKAVAPQKDKTAADKTDEEDADESDTTPSQKTQSAAAEPDTETKAPQKQESSPLNFEARGNGENELSKLLTQQRQDVLGQQLMQGANIMGAGLAKVTPNNDVYEQGIKLAGLPIEQYKERQANEANDPNSGISQGMRDYMKTKLGVNVSDNATAAQMGQVVPMVFKDIEAKQLQASHAADLKNRLDVQQSMKEAQIESARQNKQAAMANAAAIREQSRQDKLTHNSDQAVKDTTTMLETARGSKDIQNAKEAIRNVDNAKSLMAEYPDLNKMPQAQAALTVKEIGKIAQGGVSSEGDFHQLMPSSVASRIMNGVAQLGDHPTGAQLGAFLKLYEPYLDTIRDNSSKLVSERNERILKANESRLGPENSSMLRSIYSDAYKSTTKKNAASAPHEGKFPAGSIVNIKGKSYQVAPNGDDLIPQ
jgi:hypothetical protein